MLNKKWNLLMLDPTPHPPTSAPRVSTPMLRTRELFRSMAWKAVAKTVKMSNRRPVVSFTFDDFPRSAALNGARILERQDARGTFYAAGAYCGQAIDGIAQYCAEDLLV